MNSSGNSESFSCRIMVWLRPGFLVRFSHPRGPWSNELVHGMAPGSPALWTSQCYPQVRSLPWEQVLVSQGQGIQPSIVPGKDGQLALPWALASIRKVSMEHRQRRGGSGEVPEGSPEHGYVPSVSLSVPHTTFISLPVPAISQTKGTVQTPQRLRVQTLELIQTPESAIRCVSWASHPTSLGLHFPICEMGMITVPTTQEWEDSMSARVQNTRNRARYIKHQLLLLRARARGREEGKRDLKKDKGAQRETSKKGGKEKKGLKRAERKWGVYFHSYFTNEKTEAWRVYQGLCSIQESIRIRTKTPNFVLCPTCCVSRKHNLRYVIQYSWSYYNCQ